MMTNNMSFSGFNAITYGADVAWWHQRRADDYWRVRRHYPAFGLKVSYAHIINGVAGDRFGLIGQMRRPLSRRWDYSIGLGLSAYSKPFSLTADTTNIFIGSLINCLIDLGINYRPLDHLAFTFHLLHTSNGMLYRPNQGLNFLQLGVSYILGPTVPAVHTAEVDVPDFADNEFGISFSFGTVMSRRPQEVGYFPCYDVSLNFMRPISPLFSVGATLDFWYNWVDQASVRHRLDPHDFPVYVSILPCVETYFGPLSLRAGMGIHLITSNEISIPFYERVGVYYNFANRHHYVGVALNAHAGRIEFIEWTYGFRL